MEKVGKEIVLQMRPIAPNVFLTFAFAGVAAAGERRKKGKGESMAAATTTSRRLVGLKPENYTTSWPAHSHMLSLLVSACTCSERRG